MGWWPLVLALVLARAPLPEPSAADWPMFRGDPERSGFAEGSSIGATVAPVWRIPTFNVTTYNAVKASPAVAADVLYCGTDVGWFIAARVSDGAVLWRVRLGRTSHGIHASPAIAGDLVIIGAYDGA